jgi:hypothetical protein
MEKHVFENKVRSSFTYDHWWGLSLKKDVSDYCHIWTIEGPTQLPVTYQF